MKSELKTSYGRESICFINSDSRGIFISDFLPKRNGHGKADYITDLLVCRLNVGNLKIALAGMLVLLMINCLNADTTLFRDDFESGSWNSGWSYVQSSTSAPFANVSCDAKYSGSYGLKISGNAQMHSYCNLTFKLPSKSYGTWSLNWCDLYPDGARFYFGISAGGDKNASIRHLDYGWGDDYLYRYTGDVLGARRTYGWHKIEFKYTSTEYSTWVDGQKVWSSPENAMTDSLSIGMATYFNSNGTYTYVDDVKFTPESGTGNSLVAYYPFNGNANDVSGNGNNGANLGAIPAADRFGNPCSALEFDGADDCVEILPLDCFPAHQDNRTVSLWIKPAATNYAARMISYGQWSQGNAFDIDFVNGNDSSRTLGIVAHTNNYGSSSNFNAGEWAHVTVKIENSILSVYKNGILDTSCQTANLNTLPCMKWRIGGPLCNRDDKVYYKGIIDEVRIYNRALSETEIQSLYDIATLTMAISPADSGTTSPNATTAVKKGDAVAIAAIAEHGYRFSNWTACGNATLADSNSPTTTVTLSGNAAINANFSVNVHTVTFDLAGKSSRTGGGELVQTVSHGSAAAAPAVSANTGWNFIGWDTAFCNVASDLKVTAQYRTVTYSIVASAEANGSISPNGSITVDHGSSQSFMIAPAAGYRIADVLVDCSSVGPVTCHTFNNVTSNHMISARFIADCQNTVLYVSPCGSDAAGDGTLSSPFATIQKAVDVATGNCTIKALPGEYQGMISFEGKNIHLESTAGASATKITGTSGNAVIEICSSEPPGVGIKGFTITGGTGKPFPSSYGRDYYGGGIYVESVDAAIEDCVMTGNGFGTPKVNSATFGGGICIRGSCTVDMRNCLIYKNYAWACGGALLVCDSQGALARLENCTVTDNDSMNFFGYQGGLGMANGGKLQVHNSIVWGNGGKQIDAFAYPYNVGCSATVTYSDIKDGYTGAGNISSAPLFLDSENGNCRLAACSPCINSGDPSSPLDPDGSKIDMGYRYGKSQETTHSVRFIAGNGGTLTGELDQTVKHQGACSPVTAVPDEGYKFAGWSGDLNQDINGIDSSTIHTYKGHSYQFVRQSHSWKDAKAICEQAGGHLATMADAEENTFAYSICENGIDIWIGATDEDSEGLWKWVTGEACNFTNWNSGEPNNSGGENWISFWRGSDRSGRWNDLPGNPADFGGTVYFLCEWDFLPSVSQDNPITVENVTKDMTITANFTANTYTVTFDLAGKGTRNGGGELVQAVNHGAAAIAPRVSANAGWIFTGWDKPFGCITTDITFTAQYNIATYSVNFSAGANGQINGAALQTVNCGSNCEPVTAVPNEGYHFTGWTSASGKTYTDNPLTVTNVMSCMTITANFAINTYTITACADVNGKISPSGAVSVNHGASQSFTITPKMNYHITDVLVDGTSVGTAANYSFTNVSGNHTISAAFEHDKASLTMAANGNGSTIPVEGTTQVDTATAVSISAITDAGQHFVNWTAAGNAKLSDADSVKTTATLSGDATITANFAVNTYTVTFAAGTNGTLTGEASQTISHGASTTPVTAVPDAGYKFSRWTGTDIGTNTDNPLTITNVTSNLVITAVSEEIPVEYTEFRKVSIKVDGSKKNADTISVVEGIVPASIMEDDLNLSSFKISIQVDDFTDILTSSTGSMQYRADKKLYTYKPFAGQRKAALSISLADGKRTWNYRSSKLDLSTAVDNFDGVALFLTVNNKVSGNILDMDQADNYRFTRGSKSGNSEPVAVAGDEMLTYGVEKAIGSMYNYRTNSDSFSVNSGMMEIGSGYSFSAQEECYITIDDCVIPLDNPESWTIGDGKALYKGSFGNAGRILVFVDSKKNTWRAKLNKADFADFISGGDGIEIHFIAGAYEGAMNIHPELLTSLKYGSK